MNTENVEELAAIAIECGLATHRRYGPGLLESAYEALLAFTLEAKGLYVQRQKSVDLTYEGGVIRDSFRMDLLVEHKLVIEVKSVERFAPVHAKQLLTYLRLTELPLGLLMNFGTETFREGLRRVSNNYFGDWKESNITPPPDPTFHSAMA